MQSAAPKSQTRSRRNSTLRNPQSGHPRQWVIHNSRPSPRRPRFESLENRSLLAAIAPPDGFVSWWTGDNTTADLLGRNDGALFNGAGYTSGQVGSGFNFDGNDDNLQAPTNGLPIGNADRTIELWARIDQQVAGEAFFASYGAPGTSNQVYALGTQSDGRLFVSTWGPALFGPNLQNNRWYHVAATNIGSNFKLYLDGIEVASGTMPVDTPPNSTFWLGRQTMSTLGDSRRLDGRVDEVAVYSRALSGTEIQGIYSAGADGKIKTATYIAADFPSVVEGPSGANSVATFTLRRVGNLSGPATVNWETADGTAIAGQDYVAASGQITFEDGQSTQTVAIVVSGDNLVETNEVFHVRLSTLTDGYAVSSGQATIANDDYTISIGDATATEGSSALKILDRFVQANSGGLARPRTPLFGPDANGDGAQDLYVVSADTDKILLYDGKTSAFLRTFVEDSGRLVNPGDIAFGPDGNLYVSSIGTPTSTPAIAGLGSVLRYNGTTGAYLDTIMAGLSLPLGVTVASDGTVYAASFDSDEVFRRTSGGVTSVFIAAGSGGLDEPRNVLIGPDVTGDGHADLYVASQGSDGVLRYNGQTGAFIDKFASIGGLGPAWIEFAPDGTLVVTGTPTTTCCNISYFRFNGTTGAKIDQLDTTTLGWSFRFGPDGLIYGSYMTGDRLQSYVARVGPASLLAFTVNLSSPSALPVSVEYATAAGSADAGDFNAASGTITFAPGQTSRTILVQTVNDTSIELNETFSVVLSSPTGGVIVDGTGVGTISDDDTKFYVVDDATANRTFEYGTSGRPSTNAGEDYALASANSTPRGAASTATGDKVWVVDANRSVYVYGTSGNLLGSWTAGTLNAASVVEGITTNGTDVWIVDAKSDKVFRYAGAATRLSGSQNAASSFNLNKSNTNPKDLVTDGQYIWVVENGTSTDKVFQYTASGTLVRSWTISGGGGSPTGITLDPSNATQDLWIVDNNTDQVYRLPSGRTNTAPSLTATDPFNLSPTNTNPQGLADPPALTRSVSEGTAPDSAFPTPHSAPSASHDSALLSITNELQGLLGTGRKRK